MSLSFRYAAHSEIGLVRKNNQDSAYVSPTMLMVADGMGGAAAGDLASTVAITEIAKTDADLPARLAAAAQERPPGSPEGLPEGPVGDTLAVLAQTLEEAGDRLAALIYDDSALEGMGTTVCGFALVDDAVAVVNIGDSRAYLVRDGELKRVTKDHSWVQTLIDEGRITEEQALEHPHRSLILRVLNGNPNHDPDFDSFDLREGDRLLVCSDGLCGLVTDAQIAAKVSAPDRERAVAGLVDLAHDAGGYDNITIIIADIVDAPAEGTSEILGAAQTVHIPTPNEPTAPIPTTADAAGAPGAEGAAGAQGAATVSATPVGKWGRRRPTEEERYALTTRRGIRLWSKVLIGVLIPLLVLVGGGYAWYRYTQTQFYIGPTDTTAAVFQGVPDAVLSFSLSHVVADDQVMLADLPPYYAEKVRATFPVGSLDAGRSSLAELKTKAARCVAQRVARAKAATPQPAPSVTPGVTPGTTPASPASPSTPAASPGASPSSPSATPRPSPSPSPTQSQVMAAEDC